MYRQEDDTGKRNDRLSVIMIRRFTTFDATEFRQNMEDRFGIYTHFHDQCGGGFSFSYEDPLLDEHREYIEKYFAEFGITLQFSEDNKSFIMR